MKTKLALILANSMTAKEFDKLTRQLFYIVQPKSVQRRLFHQKFLAEYQR